jgi:hypothetical protein
LLARSLASRLDVSSRLYKRLPCMGTVITPVHLALFEAVTGILHDSGASPADATAAMVDITFWLAARATEESRERSIELAHIIANRAFTAAWKPAFRQV